MPTSLQIAELGDPILRKKAEPVKPEDITTHWTQKLINLMIETCHQVDGLALSAPQVGQSLRIFVMMSKPSLRYPKAPTMGPTAMINPKIIEYSVDVLMGWEGCLSIPGIRGRVGRSGFVNLGYYDRKGKWHEKTFTNFVARIIQHEMDHLNGIVFTDRAGPKTLITEKEFQKLVASGKMK